MDLRREGAGEEKRNRKRGAERFVSEGDEIDRGRREEETTSDDTAGKEVKTKQHRERSFRGRGAVEERDSSERPQEREEIDLRARRCGIAEQRRLEMC